MRQLNPQMSYIQAIQSELEQMADKITHTQSIHELIDLGGRLAAWMAFTGEQMATYKELWREAEKVAMLHALDLRDVDGKPIKNPSTLNKYASSVAGTAESDYEFVTQVNKSCKHTQGFLITAISALKAEQQIYSSTTFGGR